MGDLDLITMKPVIYVANVSEDEAAEVSPDNSYYKTVKEIALSDGSDVIPVCAGLEAEIAELAPEEKAEFLSGMGITESGLDRLIKAGYSLLGLISYLTAGPKEVRAWTITKGTKAPQAAGKIHSDFERGSSAPRSSRSTTLWNAVQWLPRVRRDLYAPKARITSCRTEM